MKRHLALTLLSLTASACLAASKPDPTYCGNNEGDRFCAELDPSKPYCVLATEACYDANGLGLEGSSCVAELPTEECRNECGIDEEGCLDPTDPTMSEGSSSTGPTTTDDSETDPTSETDTEDTTTTGPTGCQGPADCTDSALPFCVDEFCVACSSTAAPDASCAELAPGLPLCIDDACVQCSDDDASACTGTTPLCDALANTCVACEFHEQCQDIGSPACNFLTGACFDPQAVSEVNAGNNGAIQTAIDEVANGAEHAIVLTNGGGLHTVTVDGGKTIAIVSDSSTVRTVSGNTSSPIITVTGASSTAFLHRIRVDGSNGVGISVETAGTLFADSTQVSGNDGGGISIATGASAQLRNSMIAGFGGNPGMPAVISSGGSIDILYSSLGLSFNSGSPVVDCSGGSASIRNSLVVSETAAGGSEVDCAGAVIENSATETTLSPADWFGAGFATGNYHLTAAGQTQFADIAVWEDGDPPFDFDGDDRPAVDGSPDFAGADTIP